jgi:hypothetical protein
MLILLLQTLIGVELSFSGNKDAFPFVALKEHVQLTQKRTVQINSDMFIQNMGTVSQFYVKTSFSSSDLNYC